MSQIQPARDATTSDALVTSWVRADKRGDFDMHNATASHALADILGQCGTDLDREVILNGHFILAE